MDVQSIMMGLFRVNLRKKDEAINKKINEDVIKTKRFFRNIKIAKSD